MIKFRMAFGGASYGKYSTCITKDEYKELMDYANKRMVKLEGFKNSFTYLKLRKYDSPFNYNNCSQIEKTKRSPI